MASGFPIYQNAMQVTGWGITQEDEVLSDVLKELIIPFIPLNICFEQVPRNFQKYITVDKICGGYLNQSSSVCGGDSGGGLVYNINNAYHIKGIVSSSPASRVSDVVQCDPQQYSLYTSIRYHTDFIRKYVTNYGWKQNIQCARDDCTNEEIENNDRCRLPDFPQHGKYRLANKISKYTPGNYVYIHDAILLSCDTGYEVQPTGLTQLYCQGKGKWIPAVGTCKLHTRNGTESSNVTLETTTTRSVHQSLEVLDRTRQGDELCTTPSTKIKSVCKLSSLCPSALTAYLIHKIIPISCGFANDKPLVCCDDDSIPNVSSEPATTKIPSIPSTTTQKEILQVGEKSKQKCKEYEKFANYGIADVLHDSQPKSTKCSVIEEEDFPTEIPAKGKEFPHVALIGYEDKENTTHWNCGGSLISENFVLSAAHCTINYQYQKAKYILLGELVLDSSEDDAAPQKILIKNAMRHPEFNSLYNDIALFELEHNALINAYTRPGCLNTNPTLTNLFGVVSGWGESLPPNTMNKEMRKVSVDIFTNTECNHSYRRNVNNLEHGILEDKQLCAGSRNESKNICQEGSGGSLQMVNNQEKSCTYMIIGVRSIKKSCNKKRNPIVYTKVSGYIKWIEDIVWPEKF